MADPQQGQVLGAQVIRPPANERGAIGFAEKVLELLEEGRYTATYKYAVLLALMDLCLEQTQASGAPPTSVNTSDLAEKIPDIYWPHTVPFAGSPSMAILRQSTGKPAAILTKILEFRSLHAADPSTPRHQARMAAPTQYEELLRFVEWKLIDMPLRRLQTVGTTSDPFIYEIHSKRGVRPPECMYSGFDRHVCLKPNVGEYLLQLNGLLRPLIHRRWASLVAQWNELPDSELEDFLFGADRIATAKVRAGIWEIQGKRCFYCDARLAEPANGHVDHFIPWARYPDDGIANLVVADTRCNGYKSSSLAAAEHVVRWSTRFSPTAPERGLLLELAQTAGWDQQPERTISVARGIYLRLPTDAKLWLRRKEFAQFDRALIVAALSVA